jgi:hypothetical protein
MPAAMAQIPAASASIPMSRTAVVRANLNVSDGSIVKRLIAACRASAIPHKARSHQAFESVPLKMHLL